eukprot:TRINITY_DN3640_c0_g1_i2.p1 TRINITY_DN3640_c0_g1~~TRINITY_DN3640_c0_g1_i2.p1  ORF type:complete len:614 (-),score=146.37 TRINITY_DN3640_c0_g1_i2:381-2222(-)
MSGDDININIREGALSTSSAAIQESSANVQKTSEGMKMAENGEQSTVPKIKNKMSEDGPKEVGDLNLPSSGDGAVEQQEICRQDDTFSVAELCAGGDHLVQVSGDTLLLQNPSVTNDSGYVPPRDEEMLPQDVIVTSQNQISSSLEETVVNRNVNKESVEVCFETEGLMRPIDLSMSIDTNKEADGLNVQTEGASDKADELNVQTQGTSDNDLQVTNIQCENVGRGKTVLDYKTSEIHTQDDLVQTDKETNKAVSERHHCVKATRESKNVDESVEASKNEPHSENSDLDVWSLIGRKVSKKFGRKKFTGEVTSYDEETKWFKVVYEDDDSEDLERFELEPILVPIDNGKTPFCHKENPSSTKTSGQANNSLSVRKSQRREINSSAKLRKNQGSNGVVHPPEQPAESKRRYTKKGSGKDGKGEPKKRSHEGIEKRPTVTSTKNAIRKGLFRDSSKNTGASGENSKVRSAKRTQKKATDSFETPKTFKVASLEKRKSLTDIESGGGENRKDKKQKTGSSQSLKHDQPVGDDRQSDVLMIGSSSAGQLTLDSSKSYFGREVRKNFGGKVLRGRVDGCTLYYKVTFEDGDSEDLSLNELNEILLPEQDSSLPALERG